MSSLFADIFEAIRTLRVCKGTTEKEILNYVQERVGGCLSVNNVVQAIEHLQEYKGPTETQVCEFVRKKAKKPNDPMKVVKTLCTLNKLVSDGVLVKKGKRYSLPKPPPKRDDDDEDMEEDKEEDCEGDDNDDMKDSCDDLGGMDDDDDDEDDEDDDGDGDGDGDGEGGECKKKPKEKNCADDDDDEDDGDEDDDDDVDDDDDEEPCKNDDEDEEDECNDKLEKERAKEEKKPDCPENEGGAEKQGNGKGNGKGNGNGNGGLNGNGPNNGNGCSELKCSSSFSGNQQQEPGLHCAAMKKSRRFRRTLTPKAEAFAFCARDFMDLQYRAYSNVAAADALAKMEDAMEEDQELNEKSKEVSKIFQARRRSTRSKRSHLSHSNYRSRSPVKKTPADPYQHRLTLGPSEELGPPNREMFQGPGDMELDVDQNRQEGLVGVDFDLYRHRSPIGPPPPNTPGVHVDRKESCCSTEDKKDMKVEAALEGINQCALKRRAESALTMLKGREKGKTEKNESRKERHKASHQTTKEEDDEGDDMYGSMCSVCEKKKKKKKN